LTQDQAGSRGIRQYVKKRVVAYEKRREQECIILLARTYIDVATRLNGDLGEVFRLFDEFTRTIAKAPVPQRRRGKANPALDARILAAGDAAPRGQKEAAVAAAAGAKTEKDMDAARKRYNRLRAERDVREKWLAKTVSVVSRKLGLQPRSNLFKSTASVPLEGWAEGDKYLPE